jgi:hypothetical protein
MNLKELREEKISQIMKLISNGVSSPTKIGLALGFNYCQASSRVMPILKSLVRDGKIKRKINPVRYEIAKQQVGV